MQLLAKMSINAPKIVVWNETESALVCAKVTQVTPTATFLTSHNQRSYLVFLVAASKQSHKF